MTTTTVATGAAIVMGKIINVIQVYVGWKT